MERHANLTVIASHASFSSWHGTPVDDPYSPRYFLVDGTTSLAVGLLLSGSKSDSDGLRWLPGRVVDGLAHHITYRHAAIYLIKLYRNCQAIYSSSLKLQLK